VGQIFYTIFIYLYALGIRVTALWNPKAKRWVQGRREQEIPKSSNQGANTVWMHCASLGEFEQGRPLLEALKQHYPEMQIVLSFFSPSGYEVVKGDPLANRIVYLPMDSPVHARAFIDAIQPTLVLWVKYEFWFYYLDELRKRKIPLVLVSGIFRANQPFFAWYGSIWRKMLEAFTCFFVQNESSKQLLESLSVKQRVSVTGDTRFDRVIAIAEHAEPVPFIAQFCGQQPVIVAGSTWREDEIELSHFVKVHPEIKFIIAPHEIDDLHLEEVKKIFPHSIFYSELAATSGNPVMPAHVLIMNNMGMLSRVYQHADIAYVGGGFGKDGVHNVLEPAVYGKPVVFGPEYEKFDEAVGLLEAGAALSYGDPMGLENLLHDWLQDENLREQTGKAAREFVYSKTGATQQILQYIQENRLLTN